jgi:hypothetical protein
MKIEFLLFEDILLFSTLKYFIDFNYTDYNSGNISEKINMRNRDNNITDFDKLKLN